MELSRQSHIHWQRGVHEHGYPGYFLGGMLCYVVECHFLLQFNASVV